MWIQTKIIDDKCFVSLSEKKCFGAKWSGSHSVSWERIYTFYFLYLFCWFTVSDDIQVMFTVLPAAIRIHEGFKLKPRFTLESVRQFKHFVRFTRAVNELSSLYSTTVTRHIFNLFFCLSTVSMVSCKPFRLKMYRSMKIQCIHEKGWCDNPMKLLKNSIRSSLPLFNIIKCASWWN